MSREAIERKVAEELGVSQFDLVGMKFVTVWDALISQTEECERLKAERADILRESYDKMLANWKNVCASDIFQELKHGFCRQVLHMLADGQISVGKAAQTIAEHAHSGDHSTLPPLPEHEYADSNDAISWKDRAEAAE